MALLDPNRLWYGPAHPLGLALRPFAWLYCALARLHPLSWRLGWRRPARLAVPVIVVGNVTVGGTGKTPTVLALAERLRAAGWRPGILARGYGGRSRHWPRWVHAGSDPSEVGDEPLLLARRSGCPVVVGPDRAAAGRLAQRAGCDVLLCDDGLQHHALARDLEIALIDGARGLGNGHCLPAGPLREPPARLARVDWILINGEAGDWVEQLPAGVPRSRLRLRPGALINLRHPERRQPLAALRGQRVTAVAGIGHPERFFTLLRAQGLEIEPRPYPDHHRFTSRDAASWPDGPLVMTEKDAVKCAPFAADNQWFLPIDAVLQEALVEMVERRILRTDAAEPPQSARRSGP